MSRKTLIAELRSEGVDERRVHIFRIIYIRLLFETLSGFGFSDIIG